MIELTKAEQKRLAREEELVDLAIDIIHELGFAGFTLEKLTARSAYSKGTIYNHFSSREDCISSLCTKAITSILHLFEKASTFDGSMREKALAVHYAYQLYARLEPTLFLVILSSKAPGVRDKTSIARCEQMDELEHRINHFSDSMFQIAIDQGCLKNPNITVETMSFANWAMSFGTNALASSAEDAVAVSRLDSSSILLNNINILLDGMGWQPLSTEWDYQKTWQRLGTELFAEELALLKEKLANLANNN